MRESNRQILFVELLGSDDIVSYHNNYCWFGSILGHAAEVMESCEQAVELASDTDKGFYRDTRGLARALTGDYVGAIEDFQFFVEWIKQTGEQEELLSERESWIAELRKNRNPFNKATLKKLMDE